MKVICQKCENDKESYDFYKNSKKLNGLESHCKACVLKRKATRYVVIAKSKRKTKQLRLHKKVSVIDIEECTFEEVLINRPSKCEAVDPLKELVSGVLCYQNTQRSQELATAV